MCLLFVFVQALAESAVGNGGGGAHEGGGASRVLWRFSLNSRIFVISSVTGMTGFPRESPKILMVLVFWVTNVL